jgi:TatD DNase family protein
MKLVDTHTHLYSSQFNSDRNAVIRRALEVCDYLLLPNIDIDSRGYMDKLAAEFPGVCLPMLGLHPCSVKADFKKVLAQMEKQIETYRYLAVGETGLDYYHDRSFINQQKLALERQLDWARELNLPIVVHTRESFDDVIALIEKYQDGRLRGVIHCFTGDADQARRTFDANFFVGIGGVITYPKSGLAETVAAIGLDRVVLETDSPYLTPIPHRGKRNESAYIQFVAESVAKACNLSTASVTEITSANAEKLFGIQAFIQKN